MNCTNKYAGILINSPEIQERMNNSKCSLFTLWKAALLL